MAEFDAEIAELEAAYRANRVANASIATEVRSKYRSIIADEIRRRKQEVDLDFAHHLARVKARSDMPLRVIQDHILHTKSWDRWLYWRDLADIEPERVSASAAREAREKAEEREKITFDWRDGVLYVLKNPQTGVALPHDLAIPYVTDSGAYLGVSSNLLDEAWPVLSAEHPEWSRIGFEMTIASEVQRAVKAGEVEPNDPWTYLNNEDNDNFMAELAREEKKMYDMNSWITKG